MLQVRVLGGIGVGACRLRVLGIGFEVLGAEYPSPKKVNL